MQATKIILFLLTLSVLFIPVFTSPTPVHAQDNPNSIFSATDLGCDPILPPYRFSSEGRVTPVTGCGFPAFARFVSRFINFLVYVGIPVAVLLIVYGGFVIMTSMGSADKINKGKTIITGTIVGLIIAFLSFAIVKAVFDALELSSEFEEISARIIEERIQT